MTLRYLVRKEFKQFFRNPFMPKLIVMMPIMLMLVLPFAATQEVKDVRVAFVDHDRSQSSRRLIEKVSASSYFIAQAFCDSYSEAENLVQRGRADVILEISNDFERNLYRDEPSRLKVSANAVNGTKGSLGASYLQQIISDFSDGLSASALTSAGARQVTLSERFLHNPSLDYKKFMIPALLTMLLTLLTGFLPALNIVSEKERGTIEQINVSPVSKTEFILGKLLPYWIMGIFVLTFALFLAWLVYGFRPAGSLLTIYVFAIVFISLISGFGLIISNFSDTMQQAMFLIFFFMLVFMLMSGLFTPVSSMPQWAQTIDIINPLKYFITAMRGIFLKGSTLSNLTTELIVLCGFAVVMDFFAIRSFQKNG